MSEGAGSGFLGAEPLSAQAESQALAALAAREGTAPVSVGSGGPITVAHFDTLLVEQLGLGEVAEHVQQVAQAAGLEPPGYFGSEVVARYLELRYEHPVGTQSLDLYPWSPITRAEAAYSFAQALGSAPGSGQWAIDSASETLSAFSLPHYAADQLEVLRIAVSKIGMPYVWGGTTDNTADGLEHGGYDCSGFVWRVYKVSGLSWGKQILGRTAAEQAGEIPKSARIHLEDVQPGDLLFFGSAHFDSKATEANVIHEGLALFERMGDPLLRPGRVRAAAHLRLARPELHVGAARAVGTGTRPRSRARYRVITGRRGSRGRSGAPPAR